jgi:Lrp/AsnC family transcriptional regulator
MDKLSRSDLKLLDALQHDAGASQSELAERTGLSRTSVWRRVKELEEAGFIESRTTLLNPARLGFQFQVLLSVSMVKHSERTRQTFEAHVRTLPEVMECFSVSGDRDYVLQVICADMPSYNEFLNRAILDHPSVHSANSSFTLKRIKYTTALPL